MARRASPIGRPRIRAVTWGVNRSWPAGTGVWVVKTHRRRTVLDVGRRRVGQPPAQPRGEEGDRHQGGVALVEVERRDLLVPELGQQARSRQAQDGLLGQPECGVPGVELVGDGLVGGVVDGELRVEEVDGHGGPTLAAHDVAPYPDGDAPVADRHFDAGVEPLEVVGGPPVDGRVRPGGPPRRSPGGRSRGGTAG